MSEQPPSGLRLERAALVVLGLYVSGSGLVALRHGLWFYTDYLGLRMPAPLAILAGLLLLAAGTALWPRLTSGHPSPSGIDVTPSERRAR